MGHRNGLADLYGKATIKVVKTDSWPAETKMGELQLGQQRKPLPLSWFENCKNRINTQLEKEGVSLLTDVQLLALRAQVYATKAVTSRASLQTRAKLG